MHFIQRSNKFAKQSKKEQLLDKGELEQVSMEWVLKTIFCTQHINDLQSRVSIFTYMLTCSYVKFGFIT